MSLIAESFVGLLVPIILILHVVVYQFLKVYVWQPRRMRRFMEKQGISGPPEKFMVGNIMDIASLREREDQKSSMTNLSHDIVGRLLPHYVKYSKIYGKQFLLWWGVEPRLVVCEPELIRDILSSKNNHLYGRTAMQQNGNKDFVGKGLLMADGEDWVHQRRIVAPAFQIEKLKGHVKYVADCTSQMLNNIAERMDENYGGDHHAVEMEVGEQMNMLAADIIARTEFGSSYDKGRRIFEQLSNLQKLCFKSARHLWFPGSRILPTSYNRQMKALKKAIEKDLMEIIQARKDSVGMGRSESYGNDLLGLMLAENERSIDSGGLSNQHLIDNCKTFFFAGHDTSASLLTWTMMLLSSNPLWQEKARQEAMDICRGHVPSAADLPKLKILGMILNESLRLYSPVLLLPRQCFEDVKVGNLVLPKGMSVWIPSLVLHHNKEYWGEDVHEFNPARFAEGVQKACKHPLAFLPFSTGPRVCVGQNFAVIEAKVVLAMILCRFRFCLSPNYKHSPVYSMTVKPKHGVPIIFKPLKNFAGLL